MRVFPLASSLVVGLVATLPSASVAAEPTADDLQDQLVQSRVELNTLYQKSAAASERLNGARYRLSLADRRLTKEREAAERTRTNLKEQSAVVADLTVQQLQANQGTARLESLVTSKSPDELMAKASAYDTAAEVLTSSIDELTARETVHRAASAQLTAARARQQQAVDRQAAAERAIKASIARAETVAAETEQERDRLLRELAAKRSESLAEAQQRQAAIDARIDDGLPPAAPAASSAPPPTVPAVPTAVPSPSIAPPTVTSTPSAPTPLPSIPIAPTPSVPAPVPTLTPPPAPLPLASGVAATAVAFAEQQLGDPYKWGGSGPDRWDCSGLVMRAWEAAGIKLPHYAGAQYSHSSPISMDAIQPGDLLFWGKKPSSAYHVALYLGGGQYIHAPRPGRDVEIRSFDYWVKPKFAARPVADAPAPSAPSPVPAPTPSPAVN